jgi:transposase-like protein
MSQEKLNGAVDRSLERAVGERKGSIDAQGAPDPELIARARRRRFTAEYKLAIVREADACTRPGEVGALLRREGLYTSHLTQWRQARDAGALVALQRPRGPTRTDRREAEVAALRRRAERAEGELVKARKGDRGAGKRLGATGRAARAQGRLGEHRAMIQATVKELVPVVGTRAACRALGAAPATIYRRHTPPPPGRRAGAQTG